MVHGQCRTECPAGVPRGRLDPDALEMPIAQNPAVGHTVQGHAACQAQVPHSGCGGDAPRHCQQYFLRDSLDRCGKVHVPLGDRVLRLARRAPEQVVERRAGHGQAGAIVEILQIEPEGAVGLDIDQVVANQRCKTRLAVGRETHQFVFAAVDLESRVVGECGIEQAQGVGETYFALQFKLVAASDRERGGCPFAHSVERQHGRFMER